MTTTRTIFFAALVGLLGATACHSALPCPDCDDDAADDEDDTPLPDLPCGGADLMTDNLNCGSCGHECVTWAAGTPYEAGGCNEGVCAPGGWASCVAEGLDPWQNCAEICVALGRTCIPNGCAGYTGLLYEIAGDFGGCDPEYGPAATMSGGCDEPIPWMSLSEWPRSVECCCDFQA